MARKKNTPCTVIGHRDSSGIARKLNGVPLDAEAARKLARRRKVSSKQLVAKVGLLNRKFGNV